MSYICKVAFLLLWPTDLRLNSIVKPEFPVGNQHYHSRKSTLSFTVPHLVRETAKTLLQLNEKTRNFAVVAWMIQLWPLQKVSQAIIFLHRISLKTWTLCWQACFILWFPRKCLNTTIAASNDPTISIAIFPCSVSLSTVRFSGLSHG